MTALPIARTETKDSAAGRSPNLHPTPSRGSEAAQHAASGEKSPHDPKVLHPTPKETAKATVLAASGGNPPQQPPPPTVLTNAVPASAWVALRIWAEMYEDAQKARMACESRAQRGGLDPASYKTQLDALRAAEHAIGLAMRRTYRKTVPAPIRQWQAWTSGVGEHLLARLLGVIGDPAVATPHEWISGQPKVCSQADEPTADRSDDTLDQPKWDAEADTVPAGQADDETPARSTDLAEAASHPARRVLVAYPPRPRTLRQLWAYCGHGDPTRRRRKGMTDTDALALGSPRAKMLVHLMAECAMKQAGKRGARSPYRDVYDDARARYATREGWTDFHQHNAALRLVGKEILRDLWLAAREDAA